MSAKAWAVPVTSGEVTRLRVRSTALEPMPPVHWHPDGHAVLLISDRHGWALPMLAKWRGLLP